MEYDDGDGDDNDDGTAVEFTAKPVVIRMMMAMNDGKDLVATLIITLSWPVGRLPRH
jgi:hypothetical protein